MKQVSLLVLFLSLVIMSHAQEGKRTRLAFVFSPQLSWLNSDYSSVDNNGNLFGYNFGLVLDRFFDKNYAFSTGLTINTTGGKLSYDPAVRMNIGGIEQELSDVTYRLKYVEVPLTLKLVTNEFHRSRYYGQFGLYSQFNIKTDDGNGNSMSNEVNFYDMGILLGGGMEYSLGGDTYLMLGLLYGGGFIDVTSEVVDVTDQVVDDKTTLNRLTFQVGIIF
ncbi:outer membrane beta-barrel protein [Carboxylicivirga sp. M1479]|uniref:outer membrane beta-barrel protein n=1 Tax=Carboxylicivirga sp. M1479 TaxID=2594476 RepID=UPI0011780362|nr:outer membrane beta-barrel protein [Carboxylicivirga sp. M1479]TRX70493.1 PorT family protein [Carboxylicivirga sp. M1479]